MTLFRGLSAFPITPTHDDGRVDTKGLRALVRRLADANVDSIGLLGSTGAAPYLHRDERRSAIKAAVEEAGHVPVMVGIGALRTDEVLRLGRDAKAEGASAVLLAPIDYIPLTEHEVYTHFETVARELNMPVCMYNNPYFTHFTFSTDLTARLSQLPNIDAIKNPAPEAHKVRAHLGELRSRVADGFSCGYAVDWNATEAMLAGADAWYSVLGGLFPEICLEITRAAKRGDGREAREYHAKLLPLWELFGEFGSFRVMYAAVNHLEISQVQPPRPILPLPDWGQDRVGRALASLGLT